MESPVRVSALECTIFVHSIFQCFHVELFSCYTVFIFPFPSCCVLVMSCLFLCCPFFILHFFHVTIFQAAIFHIAPFLVAQISCCTLSTLHFVRIGLFSCFTPKSIQILSFVRNVSPFRTSYDKYNLFRILVLKQH